MKHRILSTGLVASLAVFGASFAASAQEPDAAAAERLAGFERTGETRNCVSLSQVRTIQPLDDRHFLIELRNRETYLNVTLGRCNQAASRNTYLQYSVPANQLCRGEIVNVIDNGPGQFLAGTCGLGDFERLEPAGTGDSASR